VRREIAQHLHGRVQGRLLALRAQLHGLAQQDGLPPEALHSLRSVVDEMGLVIQRDIATLSRRLYPSIVRRGLVPGLQSLVDQFEAVLDVTLRIDEEIVARESANRAVLAEKTRLTAYRIVEEALGNVVKHANATRVAVEVESASDGWLQVSVRDNGDGFDLDHASLGLGLAAMQDYAEAAGGLCALDSQPGRGTSVSLRLPEAEETLATVGRH
jgi:signal transduction histidine kinase